MSPPNHVSGQDRLRTRESKVRDAVARPLRCASCGYEIIRYNVVPDCPMCGDFCWDPVPWRPFSW